MTSPVIWAMTIGIIREMKRKKRTQLGQRAGFYCGLSLLLLVVLSLPAFGGPPSFSLKIMGGVSRLLGGDLNKGLQGMTDLRADQGSGTEGAFPLLEWAGEWSAELVIRFGSRLGITVRSGWIQASGNETVSTPLDPLVTEETLNLKMKALPITVGIIWDALSSSRLRCSLSAAAGLYFGRLVWKSTDFRTWQWIQQKIEGQWAADKTALGGRGGLSLEYTVSPKISIVLEGSCRYARFSGLRGEYHFVLSDPSGTVVDEGEAVLWSSEYSSQGKTYPWLVFSETKPTALYYKNTREARVSLSGFALQAGFRYAF